MRALRPRYVGGERVSGCVLLDLPKAQAISSITLFVRTSSLSALWCFVITCCSSEVT